MASSAFKSTTRRSLYGSASRSDQPPCSRRSRSRSRSVSAAPRGRDRQEDYANTRANSLFDSTASPQQRSATSTSSGGGDAARRERDRGRELVKGGRGGGRARSVSVTPQRRRTDSAPSADTAAAVGGRSSRARSVTGAPTGALRRM